MEFMQVLVTILTIYVQLSHGSMKSAIYVTKNLCREKVKDLSPNEVVQLFFSKEENVFKSRRTCILSLKLQDEEQEKLKIYEVNLSLFVNGTCWFEIDVFSGPPRNNKPLTTLTCDLKPKWKNRVPFDVIYLQYRLLKGQGTTVAEAANLSSILNVSFSMCSNCYTTVSKPYADQSLMEICNKKTCIANQYVEYTYETLVRKRCPPCKTFEFYVSESVQLCVSTSMKWLGHKTYEERRLQDCDAVIEIDNKVVLTLNDLLVEYYCLPWQLKGSSVKITFQDRSTKGWNCPDLNYFMGCAVGIKTNSTKLSSEGCSKWTTMATSTTTTFYDIWSTWSYKPWSSWVETDSWSSWTDTDSWSSWSESSDSSDYSTGIPGYFYVIMATIIVMCCLGACKAINDKTKTREGQQNNSLGSPQQNDLYQIRSTPDNVEIQSPFISVDPPPTFNRDTNFRSDPPGYADVTSGDYMISTAEVQPPPLDNVVNDYNIDNDTRGGGNVNEDDDNPAFDAEQNQDFPAVDAGQNQDFPAVDAGQNQDFPAVDAGQNPDFPAADADHTRLPPPPSYEEACRNFL